MSIELCENTLGIWWVGFGNKDWLCGLTRVGPGRYNLTYRFRYYHDDKVFKSDDRKNWYSHSITRNPEVPDPGEDNLIDMVREMVSAAVNVGGAKEEYECARGKDESFNDYWDRFLNLPFVHAEKVSEAEFRARCGEFGEDAQGPKS